jgi:short-subunit dehydrogenase
VNIGSAAGVSSSPLLAQYGAAKSYIAMFSKGACCKRMFFTALLF